MSNLIRACDFSVYQGLPDASWFKLIHEKHGVQLVIIQRVIGTTVNPAYPAATERARDAGMQVATYVWPPEGIYQTEDYGETAFIALDVEAGAPVDWHHVNTSADDGYPIIYTNRPAWEGANGRNDTRFQDMDLWHAEYLYYRVHWTGKGTQNWPNALPLVNYGGWVQPIGWQFAGEVTLEGVSVDLNVFEEDVLLTKADIQGMIDKSVSQALYDANAKHYADDHQYLVLERDAVKRIRRRGETAVRDALTKSKVVSYRKTIQAANVPLAAGVEPEPDPESDD